jgi:hypothetical protein
MSGTLVYESVAVLPGPQEDEVWVSVLRTINGQQVRTIERFTSRLFTDQADCFYVDCGVFYDGPPTTILAGLDHLEGETVAILGDGAVYPPQVVANGQVVLSQAVSKAAVGLPFRYAVSPMRIEVPSKGGSGQGSYVKIAEMALSFLNTLNAQYGPDLAHLLDIDWRTTEAYDSPPALFTGDKVVTLDGGFDPETPIVISGQDPLPCTLRAIVVRAERTGR